MDGKNTQCVRNSNMDFPGGPVVKTSHLHCRECGFDPWELKSHMQCSQKKKKKDSDVQFLYCREAGRIQGMNLYTRRSVKSLKAFSRDVHCASVCDRF